MKRMKRILGMVISAVALGVLVFFTPVAAKYGLDEAVKETSIPTTRSLTQIIGDAIGTALSYISVLFFLLMIYAGIIWMTARGNSDAEQKAKNTIIAAVIGIAIILGAYAVTKFVFDAVGAPSGGGPSPSADTSPSPGGGSVTYVDGQACTITVQSPAWTEGVTLIDQSGKWNCGKNKNQSCGTAGQCQPLCRYYFAEGTTTCQKDACASGKELKPADLAKAGGQPMCPVGNCCYK